MTPLTKLIKQKGYKLYADKDVLAAFPRSKKNRGAVEVFTLGKTVTTAELIAEYAERGLIPATADELLSIEESHDFIATIDGQCYLTFDRWGGERNVRCRCDDSDWDGDWWFAGVRKPSDLESSALPSDTLTLESLEARVKKLESIINPELLK